MQKDLWQTRPLAAPALCPRWHRVLLRVGCLGHFILLALVAALSVQVFQGPLGKAPLSTSQPGGEPRGRNDTESCWRASLVKYFCKSGQEKPSGCPGCQLCPDAWLLRRCRCYWFSKKLGTWTEGKEHCEGEGSQLLVLQDGKELETTREILNESKPVWIGLRASEKQWKWVDNSTPSAEVLRSLRASENGCGTMKQGVLENDICDGEHRWVCQKKPFQLAAATPENREKCNATG
nr:PREDICTED: killer cell lectin-like receptor subfamily B member 1B allele C [Apteryx mantelli mantelli]